MTDKIISVTKFRNNFATTLDSLEEDDILIVTRRGKEEKAIISLDKLEDLLAVSNPEYLKSIKEARKSNEFFSHEEVFGDLD